MSVWNMTPRLSIRNMSSALLDETFSYFGRRNKNKIGHRKWLCFPVTQVRMDIIVQDTPVERGKIYLVTDQFKLRESKTLKNGKLFFRCTSRKYTINVTFEENDTIIVSTCYDHSSSPAWSIGLEGWDGILPAVGFRTRSSRFHILAPRLIPKSNLYSYFLSVVEISKSFENIPEPSREV
jgi:hypothetical protein